MGITQNHLKIVIMSLQALKNMEFFMFLRQEPIGTSHSFYLIQS